MGNANGTLSLSLSLSLSVKVRSVVLSVLSIYKSPLSSAVEPPGHEIMPLCCLRSRELYFHGIADIVNELSFYALNEWKNKKETKTMERKKRRKRKRKIKVLCS